MTLATFFRKFKLAHERFGFRVNHKKHIRAPYGTKHAHCPITAVCAMETGRSYSTGQFEEAGGRLGLSNDLIYKLMHAADKPSDVALRSRLLRIIEA